MQARYASNIERYCAEHGSEVVTASASGGKPSAAGDQSKQQQQQQLLLQSSAPAAAAFDPDCAAMAKRIAGWKDIVARITSRYMGFGVYLVRAPGGCDVGRESAEQRQRRHRHAAAIAWCIVTVGSVLVWALILYGGYVWLAR